MRKAIWMSAVAVWACCFVGTTAVVAFGSQESPATRALVWDNKGQLHAIDPERGTRLGSATVRPGRLLLPPDRSRLVGLWAEPRTEIEHATILDRRSLRPIGDIPMGLYCRENLQMSDGRHLAAICYESNRKNPNGPMNGYLLGIDMATGTLTGRLQTVGTTSMFDAGESRVGILSSRTSSAPANTIVIARLPEFKQPVKLDLPCGGVVRQELLTADRRRLFVRCDTDRPQRKNAPAIPSSMVIIDLETLASPRVVPLGDRVFGTWSRSDERFIYVSSDDRDIRADVETGLSVFSIDKESVTDHIPLSKDAREFRSSARFEGRTREEGPILIQSGSSALLIRDGRVLSTMELPGRSFFTNFDESPGRQRGYVSRDGNVVAVDLAAGAQAWTAALPNEGRLTVSPDDTRLLRRRDDDFAVLDATNGKTVGQFKASSKGARAGLFLKALALSLLDGRPADIGTDIAFSAAGGRAMVLATTGEVVLVDLADGRPVVRLTERASALVGLPTGPLALMLSARQVVVYDMTAAKEANRLSFPDAPGGIPPLVAFSRDGARVAVGAGSTTYFLEPLSGRVVARADGFGRIAGMLFLNE